VVCRALLYLGFRGRMDYVDGDFMIPLPIFYDLFKCENILK
jgi:hypothetical protein